MIMVLTTPLTLLVGLGDFSKSGRTRYRVRVGDGYKEEVDVRKGILVYKKVESEVNSFYPIRIMIALIRL